MESNKAPYGMVVTPHHLATQSALAILRDGGTAIEATVAAAATIAVVYPHMNSIGGDGIWLIVPPHGDPIVIEACGAAGSLTTEEFFAGYKKIPYKGPKAANTIAGTIGGWEEALKYVTECGYQRMSTSKLLADAISYAEDGYPISKSYLESLKESQNMQTSREFQQFFLPDGKIPKVGEKFSQKVLAKTFRNLAENGLNSFYKGKVADQIAEDMSYLGIPITKADLENYSPERKIPLRLLHQYGELYNVPPPTQGLCSLSILGLLDKLNINGQHEGEFIHATIEATKQAFQLRDKYITDPRHMKVDPKTLISSQSLSAMAKNIDLNTASSVGKGKGPGDTVWMGVMDSKGFSVSFIQSIYHKFGSGLVLPKTGIIWHNRGVAFTLGKDSLCLIKPGKKPFHTLNPAAAKLNDGRWMIYGTRGGDGQGQTQAAIFHRYVVQGIHLQKSISDPRWIYGRVVGDDRDNVKLEDRFSDETVEYLRNRGHKIVMLPSYCETVGQAGALVRHPDGMMEGAFDLRSDGSAAGY